MILSDNPPFRKNDYTKSDQKRVLFYCASDVGLGHFSCLSRIAKGLNSIRPDLNLMFLTDILPLPTLEYGEQFGITLMPAYRHSKKYSKEKSWLSLDHKTLFQLRQNLIFTTLASYQPDLILMDTGPHGKKNELEKPLRWLKKKFPRTKRIMQMRDIPIPPDEFYDPKIPYREKMAKEHDLYDQFLVSGHQNLFDMVKEYQWTGALAEKVTYCGLVVPQIEHDKSRAAQKTMKKLMISFGGGWDSDYLTQLMMETLPAVIAKNQIALDIVTGPKITPDDLALLKTLEAQHSDIMVASYRTDFPERLQESDVAFLQAGSTIYQILDTNKPVILYTRDYTTQEQQVRADILKKHDGISVVDKEWTKSNSLIELLNESIRQEIAPRRTGITFDGIATAAKILSDHLPK